MHTIIGKLLALLQKYELLRFGLVGASASAIHYGCYLLALSAGISYNFAYAIAFAISLSCNFVASNYFTFRTKPTLKRAVGFACSHGINFVNELLLLNLFVWLGMAEQFAPLLVFVVAFPINFVLVRCALKGVPRIFHRRNTK